MALTKFGEKILNQDLVLDNSKFEDFIKSRIRAELNEEKNEIFCDECDGYGFVEKTTSGTFCRKCKGTGKLDWIEKITGKTSKSIIENIGVRMISEHLRHCMEEYIGSNIDRVTLSQIKATLYIYLSNFVSRRIIKDFRITENDFSRTIDVIIQPHASVEYVAINFRVS